MRIEKKKGQKGMPMMGAAMFKNLLMINIGEWLCVRARVRVVVLHQCGVSGTVLMNSK
jgi:hypothetical protein